MIIIYLYLLISHDRQSKRQSLEEMQISLQVLLTRRAANLLPEWGRWDLHRSFQLGHPLHGSIHRLEVPQPTTSSYNLLINSCLLGKRKFSSFWPLPTSSILKMVSDHRRSNLWRERSSPEWYPACGDPNLTWVCWKVVDGGLRLAHSDNFERLNAGPGWDILAQPNSNEWG